VGAIDDRKPSVTRSAGGEPERPDALAEETRAGQGHLGWLTGVALLIGVVLVATHLAEERELARLLRAAQPLWLVGAILLQAGTYVCAAAVWQRALAKSGVREPLRGLIPLGLAKLFTDQAVPSAGMSGTLLVVRSLERRGTSRGAAVDAVLTGLVAFYCAYFLATVASIAILWRYGELGTVILVPASLLCVVSLGIAIALLTLRRERIRRLPRWLARVPLAREMLASLRDVPIGAPFGRRLLLETTLLQLAIFVLDACTLDLALRAVVSPAPLFVVFASFVVASAVATLAWVPGGLGTFEGTCVAMLHLQGVSLEAALAATLLLRGFTFWLPMLPGLALAHRELGRTPRNPR
jgi:uncharacterized protein (TIRG00374 family)